jgi:hypothetical protein
MEILLENACGGQRSRTCEDRSGFHRALALDAWEVVLIQINCGRSKQHIVKLFRQN